MAQVTVTIAGRSYRMACGDGEEQHLDGLARLFDGKIDEMRTAFGEIGDMRLHVMAAPAIVNTLAIRLLEIGPGGQVLLLILLLFLAVVAIVIDRRSFLVSGAGYAVWLIFTLFDGSALLILALGLGLVLLGAQWDRLRTFLMLSLPAFPGKDRLPPYGSTT